MEDPSVSYFQFDANYPDQINDHLTRLKLNANAVISITNHATNPNILIAWYKNYSEREE